MACRLAALALAMHMTACSRPASCTGAPSTTLTEGYCKNGEPADRCYFAQPPADGF
jgi:hypothetical protein